LKVLQYRVPKLSFLIVNLSKEVISEEEIQRSQSELPLATDSSPETLNDLNNFKNQLGDILKILK
jgi:hypothetical protein